MRRKLFKPSRILATVASFLTAISSIAFAPLPADATAVNSSNGTCTADVDNTSGVTVYQNGNYCYVAFKSTGITYTWTKPADANVFDLLVVAGGGGGGTRHAGGGGAGGLIQSTSNTINANTISISVGAGGAGAPASLAGTGVGGSSGSNSVVSANGFTTQTAIGGGAGMQASSGLNGGSGGGGSCCSGTGGTGTAGQGNSGSLGWTGSGYYLGGGGGGAGGAATNANSSTYVAGVGGSGASVGWISSTVQSALGVGVYTSGATYFAGGGGGGTAVYGTAGTGGIGGGGAGGAVSTAGTNGTANTGSGGGGGGMFSDNSVPVGGNGGSGVVVFRYAIAPVLSWNASDVNSYEETVSTTAINDLSPASNYDGALYNGTNSAAPGFDRTTGAWTFTAGAASSGPYGKVTSSISTTPFSTGGVTIDFEADFGSQANDWERVMDFSANADMADNLLVARRATSNDMIVEVYNSNSSFGYCTYANGIPVNSGMNRWTIRLDGTNCIYYKNGTQVYSVAYTGKPRSGATWVNSYIARSNWSGDSTFEGSIRSLRLFAGGLAASDIPAPVTKTVTLNAYDGNTQNGGGVTNNMQSPRLTTGSVRLPTPITRAGYTFTGWYDATTFANKVGDAGAIYTPPSTITLYGGWRTSLDSTALGNLVFNFDATHIDSLPVAATSAASVYPASSRMLATAVGGLTRDTANSPGSAKLLNRSYLNFGANNAANITTTPLTVETWFKCNSYRGAGWNIIATHWFSDVAGNSTTAVNDWHFGIYNNHLQLNTGSTNAIAVGSYTFSSSDCDGTKWMHLGFTFDASGNVLFYINGRPDGTAQSGYTRQPNTSAILMLGDQRDAASILGYMSRFRMYNSALTSSQMLNNFIGEATPTYGIGPFTITYKAGPDGTGADVVETYNAGTTATLKNNDAPFNRAGYYISGWATSSASGAPQWRGLGATVLMTSSNLVLYPVWTATTYTITYNYNGATGGNGTASATYAAGGSAITLPTPTKTSYTFGGWWSTSTFDTGTQVTVAQTPSSSFTLYAKWTAGNYTLSYNYNGATGGNSTSSQTYTTGNTALTMPTPTKTGYTFGGWYAEPGFTTLVSGTQTPTASANLYAKWTAVNYTLTYSSTLSTSGTVPTDATNYNIGNNATVKANTGSLARTGYTFAGWTVASDGTGTVLSSGQTVTFASANITLYAKWTANTYAISYNVNGATGTQANASDSYTTGGTAVTLSAVGTMVKTGYNFSGWSATPTGSVIAGTYTTAADIMLYAIWTIKSISVTYSKGAAASATFISFPANTSGNYGTRVTLSNNIDSSVTFNSSTYAFVGWSDGTSLYQSGEQYLLGDTAITMTAVWVQAFGVRYIPNGGTFANGSSAVDAECLVVGNLCTNGQSITANAAPTRSGYTFTGWTDQSSNAIAAGATFTVNINSYLLYAGWTANNYSITYAPNGGSTTPTQSALHYGDTFTLANAISRTGYNFNGWNDGTTTYGAGTTYTVGLSNVTLTAQWTPLTYVITYDWNGGIGSATANSTYTVGNTGLLLPVVGNHVKDGFNFGGWSLTNGGFAVTAPFIPTGSATLYAIWGSGSYTLNYDLNYGAQASSTTTVANGNSTVLPTPARSNFVFDGWYTAATGGSKVGNAGANFTPGGSSTLYARWIQASLYGVIGNLNRISTITASDSVSSSYNGTAGGSSVSVTVPSATLPAGTVVALDVITDTTYAQSLLTGNNNYILSIAVSWLAPNETVPDTNSGKAVSMTISNNSIRAGALVYSIQNGVVTLLGTATQNGTITVQLTSDPSVYVVATVPTVPQTIASTQTSTSATVTWSAPSSDGGSALTGYTVTLNTGATCTTTLLTCTFNNLTAGTSYTASVVASNTIGSSVVGTVTFTPSAAPSGGSPAPVTPTPPIVVPPKPTEPVTPVVPIVVPVPLAQAIEKILSNNVPVLAGTPVVAPILFNPYSSKLDAKDIAMIKTAADALKDKAGWLFVTGFVKYEGAGTRLEKNLAKARATAVAKQMAKFGLRVKIGYLGYGAPNKLAPKPTDRKVELRWQAEPSQNS